MSFPGRPLIRDWRGERERESESIVAVLESERRPPFFPPFGGGKRERGKGGGTPLSTPPPSFLPTRLIAKGKRENAAPEEDAKNPTSTTSHFPRGGKT